MTSLAFVFYSVIIAQRGAQVDQLSSAPSQPGLAAGAGTTERRDAHRDNVLGESRVLSALKRKPAWATACAMKSLEKREKAQKREP